MSFFRLQPGSSTTRSHPAVSHHPSRELTWCLFSRRARSTEIPWRTIGPSPNLPFVSKVVERVLVVASQLNAHMLEHSLLEPAQSAYRRNHSTESALLRVRSDVLQATDGKKCVMLVLLDVSAAFDTIDHEVLLLRLEIDIGVCGSAVAWFRSYLSGRTQSVSIHNTTSQPQPLHYGVPQGFCAGGPSSSLFTRHPLRRSRDNTALVSSSTPTTLSSIWPLTSLMLLTPSRASRLVCSTSGGGWLTASSNLMTKRRLCCSWEHLLWDHNLTSVHGLTIDNTFISCSASARNLGAIFDQHLSMEAHVRNVCSSAFYHLHHISRIRDVLDIKTAATVIQTLVISRLDYCNSLLYGLPSTLINRLQRVQNAAARVVARGGWSGAHHTGAFQAPLASRAIPHHLSDSTSNLYRALRGLAPSYLTALLTPYRPSRAGTKIRSAAPSTCSPRLGCSPLRIGALPLLLQSYIYNMEQPTVQNPGSR